MGIRIDKINSQARLTTFVSRTNPRIVFRTVLPTHGNVQILHAHRRTYSPSRQHLVPRATPPQKKLAPRIVPPNRLPTFLRFL